jgi:TIGR03009 family protein
MAAFLLSFPPNLPLLAMRPFGSFAVVIFPNRSSCGDGMRMLLDNWRLLAFALALTALADGTTRAQAPARTGADSTGAVPRTAPTTGSKASPKTGAPANPAGSNTGAPNAGKQGAGQLAAGQQGAAPPADPAPMAPFKLTPAEEKLLDAALKKWEERNSTIKTLKCKFHRREYDDSLAEDPLPAKDDPDRQAKLDLRAKLKANDYMRSIANGIIKFKPPDQGRFQVTKMDEYDPNVKKGPKDPLYTPVTENLENWVCDGKAIHEFKPPVGKEKGEHLIHVIPEEMRGEAIADGPVPFIFGAKADKLKARYWLREITPPAEQGKRVWLEVHPKFQHDAANFRHVKVILDAKEFSLYALMIQLPSGKQQTTFTFTDIVTNDFFGGVKGDFDPPKTPRGWKRTIDPPADAPTASKPDPQAAGKREASRKPTPPAAVR